MQCPSCGYPIEQQNIDRCPRCGRSLAAQIEPTAPPQSPQPPQSSPYPPQLPQAGYGAPPPGPSAPPADYAQPYGQDAPPNYPPAPSYYQSAYPPPGYFQPTLAPTPPHKNRTGLIVGIVALVVVVLAACTSGTIFAIHSLRQMSAATHSGTPSASPTISGTRVYSNTFSSNADGWLEDPGHCFLASDGYHAANGYYCTVPVVEQDNVDISVKVKQVSGPTRFGYGLFFRQQDDKNYYAFMIASNGYWVALRCINADCTTPVYFTVNDAIRTGLGIINTIEVRATGSHFVFLVNGVTVGNFDDTALTFGRVGVIAGGTTIDCAFTDLVIIRPD